MIRSLFRRLFAWLLDTDEPLPRSRTRAMKRLLDADPKGGRQ